MSRNVEYVDAAGLRKDGRRPLEIRPTTIEFDTLSGYDGSCTVTSGRSKVCASVVGPREVVSRAELGTGRSDQTVVTCAVAVAAFAGDRRRQAQRDTPQSEEISNAVVQVVRSVVLLSQYGGSQLHLNVEVLQQDGSEKVACITAACMALVDAKVAMRDVVCALNVGLIDHHTLVDMTQAELRSQCPVLSIAVAGHDTRNIIWFETTSRIHPDTLRELVEVAQKAGSEMFANIRATLEKSAY